MKKIRAKEICKEKGITLQDVANTLGITYQSLHSIITRNPTLEKLEQVAAALGVPITELFEKGESTSICPACGATITVALKK
ncbi:MAG: helix-turn-helix transcriptional regulator [Prevotellaceae bacterium]|nr:helix-turn-helix transcriptional regulator [Prevotellaceae bacterium]